MDREPFDADHQETQDTDPRLASQEDDGTHPGEVYEDVDDDDLGGDEPDGGPRGDDEFGDDEFGDDELSEDDRATVTAARRAFEGGEMDAAMGAGSDADHRDDADPNVALNDELDDETALAAAEPFVASWNQLISTTNWDKGRIITQWRAAILESDAPAAAASDAAWVRRVGGVTAPHVGRLRRVYERFGETYESYTGLFWTHFLAALDWDDAPLWLEGAAKEGWSISKMRDARWRAMGAVDSNRPTASEIIDVDLDGDAPLPPDPRNPSDGQTDDGRRDYDGDGPGSSGPVYDEADFGDADELVSLAGNEQSNSPAGVIADAMAEAGKNPQPFKDLPELPDDLADAIETLKLSILRHKTAGWQDTDAETLARYLAAVASLLES